MPLIRYQVGDVGVLSERQCACGRGLPLLEQLEGREADYVITADGTMISGISLTENFAVLAPGVATSDRPGNRRSISLPDRAQRKVRSGERTHNCGGPQTRAIRAGDAAPLRVRDGDPAGIERQISLLHFSRAASGRRARTGRRMRPLVSVLITSYNYGRYIGPALASVRNQTIGEFGRRSCWTTAPPTNRLPSLADFSTTIDSGLCASDTPANRAKKSWTRTGTRRLHCIPRCRRYLGTAKTRTATGAVRGRSGSGRGVHSPRADRPRGADVARPGCRRRMRAGGERTLSSELHLLFLGHDPGGCRRPPRRRASGWSPCPAPSPRTR